MTRRYLLTPAAKTELIEIALWTIQNFGAVQAAKYETLLIKTCERIARRELQVRDCAILTGDRVPSGLKFASAGKHYVILLEDDEVVTIVAFLHQSSNLARQIQNRLRWMD